jgi:DNA-binding winged helix-turn-helix (wHTH) protein/tetratricopeptide (TPR) repeat protein
LLDADGLAYPRGSPVAAMTFQFGPFELDEERGELRRDGVAVEVQPKPLALLAILIRARGRVVSSDELFQALWPGVVVTPSSLTRAVSLARRAIGDTHRGEVIRSVARRGYRFASDATERSALASPGGPTAGAAPRVDAPPFVGREDALARLREAWARAAAGRGALVLVHGLAGVGKSRLVEVFAVEVGRAGGLVLVGRARDGEGVPAFWPWAQVLRRLAGHGLGEEVFAELRGVPAELAELVPELDRDPSRQRAGAAAAEQGRFLLFEAMTRALAGVARRRPLLVVLEDLQWAGAASLRVLEHLAFELGEHPLLVVATLREEPRDGAHPLEAVLPRLRQQSSFEEVPLRGFSRREVAALLEHQIGRPAPPDLTSELFARTEGVPLFLREALRLLSERGDLDHPESVRRWAVTLPAHALDLIRRPLARLPAPTAELVGAASVLGRDFRLSLATAVAGIDRDEALDRIDEATRAGVVEAGDAPGSWRFAHALFQEAALQALPAGTRARLHRRAADELERRHRDDPDRVLAEIAHHHHAALPAGDPERAFAAAWRSAARAQRLLAHEQAALHYQQALAALEHGEPVDPMRRLETLLALGEAHRLAGERAERRAAFGRALEAAGSLDRPIEAARAAIGFCDLSEWAPLDAAALAAVESALAALPGDGPDRARLLTRLAYLGARQQPEQAEPTAREAVALARRAGEPEALQDALYVLLFLLAGPDHLPERDALAREVEQVARAGGATDPTVITLLDLACDRIVFGDAAGADRWRAAAEKVAGAAPHLGRIWHLRVFDAGRALLEGRIEDAERLVDATTRIGRRIAHPYARGVERALRAFLARTRGDDTEVLRFFDPTLPIRQGPVQWVEAVVGRALLSAGREAEARACYRDLVGAGPEHIPRNIRWYGTLAEASLLCAELGDAGHAPAFCALLAPAADHHAMLPLSLYSGPVQRCLARLHEVMGRTDRALDLYEAAADSCAALGARPMRARVLLEHGRLLARLGDRRRARERLGESAQLAADIGLLTMERSVRAVFDNP